MLDYPGCMEVDSFLCTCFCWSFLYFNLWTFVCSYMSSDYCETYTTWHYISTVTHCNFFFSHSLLLANLYHAVYMHPSAGYPLVLHAADNSQLMDSYICHFASRQVSVATSSLKLDEIMRVLWMIIVF